MADNNSVESKIIGMWSCTNEDALWNYEFHNDYTGKFIGYNPDRTGSYYYHFTWSYEKENSKIIVMNIEENMEQNSFKILNFDEKDTIEAEFRLDEKTLKRTYFDYDEIVEKYGSYDDTKKYWLSGSEPEIGMSETDVRMSSWGTPKETNKTETKFGTSEQWVYDDGKYIYFENGIVTAIQE